MPLTKRCFLPPKTTKVNHYTSHPTTIIRRPFLTPPSSNDFLPTTYRHFLPLPTKNPVSISLLRFVFPSLSSFFLFSFSLSFPFPCFFHLFLYNLRIYIFACLLVCLIVDLIISLPRKCNHVSFAKGCAYCWHWSSCNE